MVLDESAPASGLRKRGAAESEISRHQGRRGGPTGNVPSKAPAGGGRGYSHDDGERRLEWEMDRVMARRIKADVPLADVMEYVRRLQRYRADRGVRGRLDERVGVRLDDGERAVVQILLREGCNVTSLPAKRTGESTPDIAVDGLTAEIKASTGGRARTFTARVSQVKDQQGTQRTFVNAQRSKIPRIELVAAMTRVVDDGDASYIRVIGNDYDDELGRWG